MSTGLLLSSCATSTLDDLGRVFVVRRFAVVTSMALSGCASPYNHAHLDLGEQSSRVASIAGLTLTEERLDYRNDRVSSKRTR